MVADGFSLDLVLQAIELRQQEVAALPQGVQAWMNVMKFTFLASVLFAPWHRSARLVLLTLLLTGLMMMGIKTVYPDIYSGDIGRVLHFVLWGPLLIYLVRARADIFEALRSGRGLQMIFGIWISLVGVLMLVSLIFDLRDLGRILF